MNRCPGAAIFDRKFNLCSFNGAFWVLCKKIENFNFQVTNDILKWFLNDPLQNDNFNIRLPLDVTV